MEIKKKIWPEYFELIEKGKKKFEVRLADFDISEGDTLILEEYDPKTKSYTGRKIKKIVKKVSYIKPTKMYNIEDIEKYGFNVIEIE